MQYIMNLGIGLDRFLSVILGGHPDDTVSQRLGMAQSAKSKAMFVYISYFVDCGAELLAGKENHCAESITGKSNGRQLWNWGGDRSMKHVDEK